MFSIFYVSYTSIMYLINIHFKIVLINFKSNVLPINILPKYINIIEGIIFYKNQKINDYIFIQKVSRNIIEI